MMDWHYELALQRELERAEEELSAYILTNWAPFRESTSLGDGAETSGLTPHQFMQLTKVAMECSAVPVVVNHLRYQIGRAAEGEGWRWYNLGEELMQTLEDELHTLSKQVAARAVERSAGRGQATTAVQHQAAWIAVTRRFLVLLTRRFEQRCRDQQVA